MNTENLFWKEKAHVKWLQDRDKSTKFFQRITNIKHAIKCMSTLNFKGILISDQEILRVHVTSYFKKLLLKSNHTNLDLDLINFCITMMIIDDINTIITNSPFNLEIKNEFFSLNKDGTHRPNGFGATFFQYYWDVINVTPYFIDSTFN